MFCFDENWFSFLNALLFLGWESQWKGKMINRIKSVKGRWKNFFPFFLLILSSFFFCVFGENDQHLRIFLGRNQKRLFRRVFHSLLWWLMMFLCWTLFSFFWGGRRREKSPQINRWKEAKILVIHTSSFGAGKHKKLSCWNCFLFWFVLWVTHFLPCGHLRRNGARVKHKVYEHDLRVRVQLI